MTTALKRSGAALLSLLLLCVLAIGAGAAAAKTVGVKFWKEKSDKGIHGQLRHGLRTARPPSPASPTAPIP